ncbi:histidine triad nucleotide-binding protein [Candidatus Riflebacteria bacterium]
MSDCLFCQIIKGKIPCQKRFENEQVLAFDDVNPRAPVHILIIPKKHIANIGELNSGAGDPALLQGILTGLQALLSNKELHETLKKGYRLLANTGQLGGQTVDHLHFHLLGGRQLHWPPG